MILVIRKNVDAHRVTMSVALCSLKPIRESYYRYNLVTTHTAQPNIPPLALKRRILPEIIMEVTGHTKFEQFADYLKFADEAVRLAFAE